LTFVDVAVVVDVGTKSSNGSIEPPSNSGSLVASK
jgi:hypothetical protein